MHRRIVAVLVCLTLIGCAVKRVSQVDPTARDAIAYAATARYPGNPQWRTDKVQAAAVVDTDAEQVQVFNLSDNAIASPTVWVNGTFLRRVPTIAPRGSVTIGYGALLQAGDPAMDFKRARQPVTKVELQTADGLYTVQGPSRKSS